QPLCPEALEFPSSLPSPQWCPTKQYTAAGECCEACPPGEGMKVLCGEENTECEICLDSEYALHYSSLFRDLFYHLCTMTMNIPCMDSFDTVCSCMNGFYLNSSEDEKCLPCEICDNGSGVLEQCTETQNTICEVCPPETYSDQKSSIDPCMPCTICEENEMMVTECSSVQDTVCTCKSTPHSPRFFSTALDVTSKTTATVEIMTTTAIPSSPKLIWKGNNDNIIPVYCSILAAVVVGLVAYAAFKRWNSCKQNKQGANNRTVNQTPSPEGEKLHSDSGISVDGQSCPSKCSKMLPSIKEVKLYTTLPPHKKEEVEKLLKSCEEEAEWCSLAGLLGYNEKHIDTFKQDEYPVHALLSDWSAKDSATMDELCTALRKLKRDDIVESLSSEPTATSAV
uniref:Nerve growth factor receptor n=1 Tax=Callorhinchus milii TaxID=7868 RepID=A0A4W3HX13_CALMI